MTYRLAIRGIILALTGAASLISTSAVAQPVVEPGPYHHETYQVPDWRLILPSKRVEFQTYRSIVIADPNLTVDQKAAMVTAKYNAVENDVRVLRTAAYSAVKRNVGVGNSCTKGSSGGDAKVCNAKCASAPLPDTVAIAASFRGAYKSGDETAGPEILDSGNPVAADGLILDNGATICALKLKQSGKGRKVSWSQADFAIREARIAQLVAEELATIMQAITRSPV